MTGRRGVRPVGQRDPAQRRIMAIAAVVAVGLLVILGQLWYLQVLEGDHFREASDKNRLRIRPVAAPRGILFDRPHVIAGAAMPIREAGLTDRCQLVSGDFFDRVPAGGDLYLMKKVIHDWDDARAHAILANCRAVMSGNSRLVLSKVLTWLP